MNNYNKKLKLNEFIFFYCGIYILNFLWVFIIFFLTYQLILTSKTQYELGVYILAYLIYGLPFAILVYIYYWTAKGLINQKNISAILAIIIINFHSFYSKYDIKSMLFTIYNIILSLFLLYSIIYSLRGKR